MENILILDTNAYSDWRRSGRWQRSVTRADRLVIPVTVLGELFHGFRGGRAPEENLSKLEEFLSEPQVEIRKTSRRIAEIYGDFAAQLQRQGTPIPTNDIWIAAATHECRGKLASRDDHFRHLPQVMLEQEPV